VDNISDWAVAQFLGHYISPSPSGEGEGVGSVPESSLEPVSALTSPTPTPPLKGRGFKITKDAIFAYRYTVLHDPACRRGNRSATDWVLDHCGDEDALTPTCESFALDSRTPPR
jgi:hypothetical protein